MVTNEVDVGYKVTVSKVFEATGTADESGDFVVFPEPGSYVKNNTQYLVTLDVNGVNKLYRELWTSGDTEDNTNVPLSDYTYVMDEYAITGLSEDDEVVVRFEEVEVKTTDAFRAAVKKDAPETPNELPAVAAADKGKFLHANESTGALEWAEGGSGGGVLVVHQSGDTETGYTLDKTWQEIYDADYSVIVSAGTDSKDYLPIRSVYIEEQVYYVDTSTSDTYGTTSADGYPKIGGK